MKTILTSLFLMFAAFSFAQTTTYTYVDGAGNKFVYDGVTLSYTPVSSGAFAVYTGATAKSVTCTKEDVSNLDAHFQLALDTKTDQINTKPAGSSTIKYKKFNKDFAVHLKQAAMTKVALEKSIKTIISR